MSESLHVLNAEDVRTLLEGEEHAIIDAVSRAYQAHSLGQTSVPHSSFLRFPNQPRDRIIALPAFVGGSQPVTGIKWVASFPGNVELGLARASAVVVLNSIDNGRPQVLLEGAQINAIRTAASAALAAKHLGSENEDRALGFVGCGVINRQILRFLVSVFGAPSKVLVWDSAPEHATGFVKDATPLCTGAVCTVAGSLEEIAAECSVVSFATTALVPHVSSEISFQAGSTVLHVSLRDLTPEMILEVDNVVDDIDHVCRAETSVHLAEQQCGNREFVRCELGDVLLGRAPPRADPDGVSVFSPFGLGILDLAVAQLARELADAQGVGTHLPNFLPEGR